MTAPRTIHRSLLATALAAAIVLAGAGAACAQAADPGLGLRLEGGKVVLTWEGERGFEYTVERSPDMRGWSDATAGPPLAGAGAPLEFRWPPGAAGDPLPRSAFFRLRSAPIVSNPEIQGDGIDNDGDGQTDEPGEFFVTGPLERTSDARPTITWQDAPGAETYSFRLSTEPGCPDGPSLLESDTGIHGNSYALGTAKPDGHYFACVSAHNAGGETVAQPEAMFEIDTSGPGSFAVTSPAVGTTLSEAQIEVRWSAATEAVHYDIILSRDPECALLSTDFQHNIDGLSHTFTAVPEADGYYVCVTAEDSIGNRTTAPVAGPFNVDIPISASAHRLIFASSGTFSVSSSEMFPPSGGTFNGHVGADYQCTNAAFTAGMVPGWNGTDISYRALIGIQALTAREKFDFEEPLYNLAGELVAEGTADMFDGSIQNAVGYNEFGQLITSGLRAWTGADTDGSWSGSSCGAFNNPVFFDFSMIGNLSSAGGTWLQLNEPDCLESFRLYCISPLIDQSQPGAFQISGPSGTIRGASPLVSWTRSQWADRYHVRLASDAACTTVLQQAVVAQTARAVQSWEPAALLVGDYFVCIDSEVPNGTRRAADNDGLAFSVDLSPPAETYRRAFATAATYLPVADATFPPAAGQFHGTAGADYQCSAAAAGAGLIENWDGSTPVFRAVLAEGEQSFWERFAFPEPIYNTHGDRLADDAAGGLFTSSFAFPIGYDQHGNYLDAEPLSAWGGEAKSPFDPEDYDPNCSDWAAANHAASIRLHQIRRQFSGASRANCLAPQRLFCIGPPTAP